MELLIVLDLNFKNAVNCCHETRRILLKQPSIPQFFGWISELVGVVKCLSGGTFRQLIPKSLFGKCVIGKEKIVEYQWVINLHANLGLKFGELSLMIIAATVFYPSQ